MIPRHYRLIRLYVIMSDIVSTVDKLTLDDVSGTTDSSTSSEESDDGRPPQDPLFSLN